MTQIKISLLIYNQLQDLTVSNCFRFYCDFMSLLKVQPLLLFVLDMNVVLSVHFYVDPKLTTINYESLRFNVLTMEYPLNIENDGTTLNILCTSNGKYDVLFSIYRNLWLFYQNIRTNENISYPVYLSSQTNKDSNSGMITYSTSNCYFILQIHNLCIDSCFHGIIFANGYTIYVRMEITAKVLIDTVSFGYASNDNINTCINISISTRITQICSTKCLVFAQTNNNKFQSQMREYFGNKIGMKCKYQSSPVKLSARYVVKAISDYGKEDIPSCANILDYMKVDVTFDNVCNLLNGLNRFLSDISKGNSIECLLSNGVLRIKNGFNDILHKWNDESDASYVDIKLNIMYIDKNRNKKMIVEAWSTA